MAFSWGHVMRNPFIKILMVWCDIMLAYIIPLFLTCARITEPRREKPGLQGFRPGLTQPELTCTGDVTRGGKCWIKKVEELFYPRSENKAADQIRSCCEAALRLCFRLGKNPVFITTRLIFKTGTSSSYLRPVYTFTIFGYGAGTIRHNL